MLSVYGHLQAELQSRHLVEEMLRSTLVIEFSFQEWSLD